MKAFIISGMLLALGAVVLSAPSDHKKEVMKYSFACMKEHGVKMEDFEKLLKHAPEEIKPEDFTDNMKCSIKCVMKKMGFMDDSGKMQPDAIKEMIEEEEEKAKFDEAFKECGAITHENPCEAAFLTFGCMAQHKMADFKEE